MSAPARTLRTATGELALSGSPGLMGIINATPDSFSDGGEHGTLESQFGLARQLVQEGARIIDVGGESGVTDRPPVPAELEIERVVPLVQRVRAELGVVVSEDTYKAAVAEAAVAAGAGIVNDISGLRDPELADVCAATGAALVLMHTRAAPKHRLLEPVRDESVVSDVSAFLSERIEAATARGVAFSQLLLDPGPDFGKTPSQTVAALRALGELHRFGRPLLLAVSRKDFIGAILHAPPRERLAGTLAAIGYGVQAGAHVVRVHDVRAAADFLAVRGILRGDAGVSPDLRLPEELRRQRRPVPVSPPR